MNNIRIYLAESGAVADLKKDFNLYQGSYQNKLLNIYVPTSILAPEFVTLTQNGDITGEFVAGTAVKIGMRYTARDGSIKISRSYYLRYLKTLKYNNVEYALFERKLPKEFTLYAGQGQNAPQLVANVVNVQTDVEPAKVLSVITTQTCYLDVMPSSELDQDEAVDASEWDEINAEVGAIRDALLDKQDKVDESIELEQFPDEHSVVGAINKVGGQVKTNTDQIETNRQDIAENRNDIDYLKQNVALPEDYVGQMSGTSLPSNEQLTQFVVSTEGRQPKNADVIIFILEVAGGTNKNYKYIFSAQGWNGYEIPPLEEAFNGSLGLIEGTYGIGSTANTLVDISGGKILHIYTKDENGVYRDIQLYLNELQEYIDNIISGNTSVGKALRAVSDELGNNIVSTYLTQNLGATKQWVKDYALPRTFNDIYFISNAGYSKEVPTSVGAQFQTTTNAVGDFRIFQVQKQNDAQFELSAKNSSNNNIFIASNRDCAVYFRLTTEIQKQGRAWTTLAVELSNKTLLSANEISKVTFGSSFTSLGETVLSLNENDLFRQTLEVVTEESASTTFTVYSNETYPSTFNLNTQTYTPSAIELERGNLLVLGASGVIESGNVVFTVEDGEYFEEYKTNQREFIVDLILPVVGDVNPSFPIRITFGDTTYNVFNILKGANPITIGELAQVGRYNTNTGYRYITKMVFFTNEQVTGFAIIPTVSVSDVLSLSGAEMASYMSSGGLKQGQVVICNETGNGYEIGNQYKFKIVYPNTYSWELITANTAVVRLTT